MFGCNEHTTVFHIKNVTDTLVRHSVTCVRMRVFDRVETPMERRVKRWGFSLSELLADVTGRLEFETYLEGEFSSENLKFWLSVEQLKQLPESQVDDKVNEIFE